MGFKSRKRKQAAISGPELESAATAENEVLEKGETSGPAKKKLKMKKRKASEGNDADLSATCHTASTANPSDKTSKGNAQSADDEVSHKVGTAPALQAAGKQRPKEVQKKKKMDSKTSNEGASVIIGGLPFSCTQEALLKDFSTCGQIRKVNLPKDPKTGLPKGFAFLLFAAQAGAQAALKFDGKDYRGRRISARMALDKPDIEKRKSAETFKDGDQQLTVFVASLPHDVQESKLRMRFSDAGHIKALKLPLNEAGKPKGFAFITFDAKDEVAKALKMNGKQFEGQCLVVRSAGARPQKTADNVKLQVQGNGVPEQNTAKGRGKGRSNSELTVFVSGFPYLTKEKKLKNLFARCGFIEDLTLPMCSWDESQCRGFAFIRYKDNASFDKALELDGKEFQGRYLSVKRSGDTASMHKDTEGHAKQQESKARNKSEQQSRKATEKDAGQSAEMNDIERHRNAPLVKFTGKKVVFDSDDDD